MSLSNDLRIECVRTAKHRADFFRVKRDLYRNDPAAVIPFRSMEWRFLDSTAHPFYEHAEREVFVAYRGRKPIGRIAAIIDRMHNEHYQEQMGFFGFFESPNDSLTAEALIKTATDFLRQKGCQSIRGPMNPSMKGEFGVLVEGHEHPPRVMMAHTPAYYHDLLVGLGFDVVKRFFAFNFDWMNIDGWQQRFEHLGDSCARIQKRFPDLKLERATAKNVESRLREINGIGNRIRSVGWGFVPLTEAELDYMVLQMKRVIRPDLVVSAYYHGQLVGYIVNIPNVNWAIKRTVGPWDWLRMLQMPFWMKRIPQCRLIALGVDPEWRRKGIAALLTKSMTDLTPQFKLWEFGWIAEDNLPSMSALDRALPLVRYKTYHVYEKPID